MTESQIEQGTDQSGSVLSPPVTVPHFAACIVSGANGAIPLPRHSPRVQLSHKNWLNAGGQVLHRVLGTSWRFVRQNGP